MILISIDDELGVTDGSLKSTFSVPLPRSRTFDWRKIELRNPRRRDHRSQGATVVDAFGQCDNVGVEELPAQSEPAGTKKSASGNTVSVPLARSLVAGQKEVTDPARELAQCELHEFTL
ncbi:MAG: hypothetical protein EXS36_17020 [Pedosphaera sp.]|nr:hypothetical protein [Pedosphaera sp.]